MRIVSLVPSLTELLCDLGLRDRLVGCTKFCVHPADLRRTCTVVGGTKNVGVERVRALRPDVVVASKEENVREQVEQLASFSEVVLTDVTDLDSAAATTRHLARRLGDTASSTGIGQASPLHARAEELIAANAATLDRLYVPNRGRALYLIWRAPHMSVGADTYIHSVLERVGYANVCADHTRYPSLSEADIAALDPAHILLSSEPYPFKHEHIAEYQALCPRAEVCLIDGELYSWYGSRLARLGSLA